MGDIYVETLCSQKAAGALFNTYSTAKSVLNADCMLDLPRSQFWVPGRRARIEIGGAISNIVTTPGTMNFQVKLGTIAAPVTVYDSGALQLNATAHTTLPFWGEILLRCDKDNFGSGTTSKLFGRGKFSGVMFTKTAGQTDGANSETVIHAPVAGYVLGAGFDATIVTNPDLWTGFSISNAGNGIRIDDYAFTDLGLS